MKTQSHSHCRICNLQNDCNALPFFWPVFCFIGCETLEALRKTLEFLIVVDKTLIERPKPEWATENKLRIGTGFQCRKICGTDKEDIQKDIADGGHIGLFMGHKPLEENWPRIVEWMKKH